MHSADFRSDLKTLFLWLLSLFISLVLKIKWHLHVVQACSVLVMFLCCRKLYVVISVVLCLLASALVAFFLFPRTVVVVDDGIHSVTVRFDHTNMKVLMNMTVGFLPVNQKC